jgi:hypothetical protein
MEKAEHLFISGPLLDKLTILFPYPPPPVLLLMPSPETNQPTNQPTKAVEVRLIVVAVLVYNFAHIRLPPRTHLVEDDSVREAHEVLLCVDVQQTLSGRVNDWMCRAQSHLALVERVGVVDPGLHHQTCFGGRKLSK